MKKRPWNYGLTKKKDPRLNGGSMPGKSNPFWGKRHTEESLKKIRAKTWKALGLPSPTLGRKLSEETKEKIRKVQLLKTRRGKESNLWKHGKYPEHLILRRSAKYKAWRKAVFERDRYACVLGGQKHGNKLQADHIKSFSKFPKLRFDLSNGRTLCVECHKKTPSYGRPKKS